MYIILNRSAALISLMRQNLSCFIYSTCRLTFVNALWMEVGSDAKETSPHAVDQASN